MSLRPEEIDHINTINWFGEAYPEFEKDLHHFANERKCSVMEGRKLKRMGVRKGVLDFHLAIPCGGYHGLWIELKVGKGRLSEDQIAFIKRKNEMGYLATAVWGHEATKEVIISYLSLLESNCLIIEPKNCS